MPEYLAPGVYVEEVSRGPKAIEGVSTSNAGFLGLTKRGPINVELITSPGQFLRLYGGYMSDSYMTFAVDGFFKNGGSRCFVGRVVRSDALQADLDSLAPIKFDAVGPGDWGNQVGILIENASVKPTSTELFKLTIGYWDNPDLLYQSPPLTVEELKEVASTLEVYDNVSCKSNHPEYYVTKINASSVLVNLETTDTYRPTNNGSFSFLTDGDDGSAELSPMEFKGDESKPPAERTGLAAFKQVDEINIVYVPDLYKVNDAETLCGDVVAHCENMKDRFAILDAAKNTTDFANFFPPLSSKYAAIYTPWIEVFDPLTNGRIFMPPGGHIAGIYARSDQERGVHKAPANEAVRGALGLEMPLTKGEQDILNPRGINVIRSFPGRGILVWGARTISSDPEWKYINVRRLFLYLEESIDEGTQWVVFEPNNEQLWARVKQTVVMFLTTVWRTGALMGTTPEEAFFVTVDRSTMTQDDIDNGRLIVEIGVAPTKPAEFVIFRLFQWTAGAQ